MKKFLNVLYWLLIIGLISLGVYIYQTKYFNDYLKTMKTPGAEFSRTDVNPEELISGDVSKSYKISSEEYNNALFYKNVKVEKNTPYKVTCFVKTENVEYMLNDEYKDMDIDFLGGANICIYGFDERSKVLTGTNDWQKLEFIFNSKDRDNVDIAFRLGTDMADAKGTVWFSDIKLEKGEVENTKIWNFGMFVFKNLDVVIDGKEYKEEMTEDDLELIRQDIDNFRSSIKSMSANKIDPKIDIIYVEEPITEVSLDKTNGYYIDMYDVYDLIFAHIDEYKFDHAYFIFKSDDLNKENENKTSEVDWVGLGGMFYNDLGYSNIRLPKNYEQGRHMFIYDRNVNTFPEEVFVHEFLHSLEQASSKLGEEYPSIHSYEEFGYKNDNISKLKKWYTDFLNKEITNESIDEFYGLDKSVYAYANSADKYDFNITEEVYFDAEPENFIEGIKLLTNTIKTSLGRIIENINNNK